MKIKKRDVYSHNESRKVSIDENLGRESKSYNIYNHINIIECYSMYMKLRTILLIK